eukprot:1005932-Pyramimonas_sp.AAC.1
MREQPASNLNASQAVSSSTLRAGDSDPLRMGSCHANGQVEPRTSSTRCPRRLSVPPRRQNARGHARNKATC